MMNEKWRKGAADWRMENWKWPNGQSHMAHATRPSSTLRHPPPVTFRGAVSKCSRIPENTWEVNEFSPIPLKADAFWGTSKLLQITWNVKIASNSKSFKHSRYFKQFEVFSSPPKSFSPDPKSPGAASMWTEIQTAAVIGEKIVNFRNVTGGECLIADDSGKIAI